MREAIEEAGVRGELMVILIFHKFDIDIFSQLNLCDVVINPFRLFYSLLFF